MTNEVVDAVAKTIAAAYPDIPATLSTPAIPGIPVYTEKVEQGIEEPSFVVRCYRDQDNLFRGKRYFKEHRIEVQYFPSKENRRKNVYSVQEKLFRILEWIEVGKEKAKIMGKNMDAHIDEDDSTLIFTLAYNYYTVMTEDKPDMMEILEENEVYV